MKIHLVIIIFLTNSLKKTQCRPNPKILTDQPFIQFRNLEIQDFDYLDSSGHGLELMNDGFDVDNTFVYSTTELDEMEECYSDDYYLETDNLNLEYPQEEFDYRVMSRTSTKIKPQSKTKGKSTAEFISDKDLKIEIGTENTEHDNSDYDNDNEACENDDLQITGISAEDEADERAGFSRILGSGIDSNLHVTGFDVEDCEAEEELYTEDYNYGMNINDYDVNNNNDYSNI